MHNGLTVAFSAVLDKLTVNILSSGAVACITATVDYSKLILPSLMTVKIFIEQSILNIQPTISMG